MKRLLGLLLTIGFLTSSALAAGCGCKKCEEMEKDGPCQKMCKIHK